MRSSLLKAVCLAAAAAPLAAAVDITWTDECTFDNVHVIKCLEDGKLMRSPLLPASIKEGASTIAYGLMKYYTGNNTGDTPGNLPDPYYCSSFNASLPEVLAHLVDLCR